jgi:hypothetical protein
LFIHLGGDTVIRSKDVIAILNSDVKDSSKITKEFLKEQKKDRMTIIEITKDLIKSVVITKEIIYFSPISSITLKKRAQAVADFDSYAE